MGQDYMLHIAAGDKKSSRIEMLIDRYIREVFEEHHAVLTLEPQLRMKNQELKRRPADQGN